MGFPVIAWNVACTNVVYTGGGIAPQYIKFLTPWKAYSQIAARLVLGQRKDRYVPE